MNAVDRYGFGTQYLHAVRAIFGLAESKAWIDKVRAGEPQTVRVSNRKASAANRILKTTDATYSIAEG